MFLPPSTQLLVVGTGNAGLATALSAASHGIKEILIIDKCPPTWVGGNTFFTAGAFRTAHNGLSDLLPIVNNVPPQVAEITDLPPYTESDFRGDMERVCQRAVGELGEVLVRESRETIKWLAKEVGVRFQLSFNRQAFFVEGRQKFWGGLALMTEGGGKGLVSDYMRAVERREGVRVVFETAVTGLRREEEGGMWAVEVEQEGQSKTIKAQAVVLAAGGFEANAEMRAKHLGAGWDRAYVRGTPYNTGDLLTIALRDLAAKPFGQWSGCHSTCWDAHAPPDSGNRAISNEYTKSGYPLGLMLNTHGQRFVDEGIEFRNFTYAIFGRRILEQPEGTAWQIWDSQTIPWLRAEEYRDAIIPHRVEASSLENLAEKCVAPTHRTTFLQTLQDYNTACPSPSSSQGKKWNPSIKDGLSTNPSLHPAKSNWALPINQPPYLAIKVTGGITFTFGGLAVDPATTSVLDTQDREIEGMYCVGEMLGGLFYENYPGGSGLTSGAVFGRRAGRAAARKILGMGVADGDGERARM